MIESYLDESGIHDGAKVCAVGGFYGSQAAWRKFERQWKNIIADYPELSQEGFHAKNFFKEKHGKRYGSYSGWSTEKADKFLNRLVQCVMRNAICPIGYAVVVEDFKSLPLLSRRWFTGAKFDTQGKLKTQGCPNKSYYVPFQWCVFSSAKIHVGSSAERVHFFAGLDRKFSQYAADLYKRSLDDPRLPASIRGKLGGIAYPSAKDTPGLQAADLLVNRMYDHALYIASGGDGDAHLSLLLKNLTTESRII